MKQLTAVIGEERAAGQGVFDVLDPSTGELIAQVARCGTEEVDDAVSAARDTFESTWRHTTAEQRSNLIRRLAELVRAEREPLADLESHDTGKPLSQARADADVAARYLDFYASAIETFHGESLPDLAGDMVASTRLEPLGVTGHILPWNYPLQMVARSIAPALAAGNCSVVKPAEEAPLSILRLAELALEAGLPPGALNVVPGYGAEAGAALAGHAGVNHISFTGSVEVGVMVAKAAADNVVPVLMELGGKSPNIVFPDADLDRALPVITKALLQNAGQTCSAGARLLVHQDIHEAVVTELVQRLRGIRIGAGFTDPDLGPLISAAQLERVSRMVEEAAEYAKVVHGGARYESPEHPGGFYFSPTVFDEVDPSSRIGQDEVFGPVLAVTPFRDVAQAVEFTNGTEYGLVAGVWTRSMDVAHHMAREIRAGQVYLNAYGAGGGVELPFGGYKKSGYGREKGVEALRSYSQTKSVVLQIGQVRHQ
ncbi:aldehyde dehydrogenase family protein [Streptomyces sp. NPDC052721]|uniref:aldehyde dehydrogenase family protein n=1 Tax=Streptomyces sp. NPDC052721 TaxID=3154955 RepID=UPI003426864A